MIYLQLLVYRADDLVAVQCLDTVNRSVDLFGRDKCQLKKTLEFVKLTERTFSSLE